jgi:hypothetical protein
LCPQQWIDVVIKIPALRGAECEQSGNKGGFWTILTTYSSFRSRLVSGEERHAGASVNNAYNVANGPRARG